MWRTSLLILLLALTLLLALLVVLRGGPDEAQPKRIEPLDVLAISARGTLLDRPLHKRCLVEPGGGVSLDAAYGRVQVQGLTLPEAALAIQKKMEEVLMAPKVELLDAGHAAHWRPGPPQSPYRISPDDVLWIDVCGTLRDAPIYAEYTVDPNGNVDLGKAYGSVALRGLTIDDSNVARGLALEMVSVYGWTTGGGLDSSKAGSLSALDLTDSAGVCPDSIESLNNSLNAFVRVCCDWSTGAFADWHVLAQKRQLLNTDCRDDQVDLGVFMNSILQSQYLEDTQPAIWNASADVVDNINQLVLHPLGGSRALSYTGVSVFFPKDATVPGGAWTFLNPNNGYDVNHFDFVQATGWDVFLRDVLGVSLRPGLLKFSSNGLPIVSANPAPELRGSIDDSAAIIHLAIGQNTYTAINNGDGTWTLPGAAFTSSLPNGQYTVTAMAFDTSGTPLSDAATAELLIDTRAPTSRVNPLARRQSSLSFTVSVGGNDAATTLGVTTSGVASYSVFYSEDGGPWTFWQKLDAASPSTVFTGQSNHSYAFRSVATDVAGNVEAKSGCVEAGTYVPDLTAPVTAVTAVSHNTATFTVSFQGSDAGGSGLGYFDVYLQKDGSGSTNVAHVVAGSPGSNGIYSGSIVYQAAADGQQHTYRFYTVGTDGVGNVETPSAGVTVITTFTPPPALAVTSFDVQHGSAGRSYIRYLDLSFNETAGLQSLINSIGTAGSRIQLIHYDLNGQNGQTTSLVGDVRAVDHVMEFAFGQSGLGGNASSTAGDGYYELKLDLDGNGTFETVRHFYRLLGDVNGDRTVDNADIALITSAFGQYGTGIGVDVNGDGTVNATDRLLAMAARGRHLLSTLAIDR